MFLNRNIKIPNRNAFYHFIIGLIFLGMAGWVASEGMEKEKGIDQFDWVYIGIFSMVGVWFSIKGLSSIFRKAYVRVDDEKIAVKPDEFTKSETILWRNIQKIIAVDNNFDIVRKDNSVYTIHFSYYTYQNAEDLKEAIRSTAKENGIKIEEN